MRSIDRRLAYSSNRAQRRVSLREQSKSECVYRRLTATRLCLTLRRARRKMEGSSPPCDSFVSSAAPIDIRSRQYDSTFSHNSVGSLRGRQIEPAFGTSAANAECHSLGADAAQGRFPVEYASPVSPLAYLMGIYDHSGDAIDEVVHDLTCNKCMAGALLTHCISQRSKRWKL